MNHFYKIRLRTFWGLFFSLCHLVSFAQQELEISGQACSSEGQSLPYVNIGIKGTNSGTYTNESGNFNLKCHRGDTVIFSSIGFRTKIEIVSDSILNVKMEQSPYHLDEVIITPCGKKVKETSIGFHKKRSNGGHRGSLAYLMKIEAIDDLKNKKLTHIHLVLDTRKVDFEHLKYFENQPLYQSIRVKLLLETDIPSHKNENSLLSESVYLDIDFKQRGIVFNIDSHNIYLSERPIYAGIEFIGYNSGEKFVPFNSDDPMRFANYGVSFSNKHERPLSWYRNDYIDNWKLLDVPEYFNFNIGISYTEEKCR